MQRLAAAGILATMALAGAGAAPAPKPADDLSIRMGLSDIATVGPEATLTVRNLGTNPQAGATVRIFAESETGLELWSGTVDVAPGKSAKVVRRAWLDADTTTLVATVTPAVATDEDPTDNADRGSLGFRGRAGRAVVGRSLHLARCATCHGDDASGGAGPSLVGATAAGIAAAVAAGGDHDFPWLSKQDARDLALFFRDPAGVDLPPALPEAPPGGWPTFSGAVGSLLDDRCIRCHGAGFARGGVRLDTLSGASKNARRALFDVRIGRMPQGGKRFSPDEIAILQNWIDGGRRP